MSVIAQNTGDALQGPRLLAVVVLYQRAPEAAQALSSLTKLVSAREDLARRIGCLVYDNSPLEHSISALPSAFRYHHDGTNPGLARAYEVALHLATSQGIPWLMLLDQDTTVTEEYLLEVLRVESSLSPEADLVAMAPKLFQDGDLLSPHWPILHRLRRPLHDVCGRLTQEVRVFNSGSVLRVSALNAIGGFPQQFPLDFLDHAVYRQLQRRGGKVYLLHATLQHELGSKYSRIERDYAHSQRIRSILLYESRFFRSYGSRLERSIHTLRRSLVVLRLLARKQLTEAYEVARITLRGA